MSIMCFNYRGLGDSQVVKDLHGFLWKLSPNVVFLSKTKCSSVEMHAIFTRLGSYSGIVVDARGRSGGLALLWDDTVHLSVLSSSLNQIDTTLCLEADDITWRFTGIYG